MLDSRLKSLLFLSLALLFLSPVWAQESEVLPDAFPDIPYQKFVLDNGLTLIVHEDHKAPIVAVNVWYHVGSKNEPTGRSGFAHLFEHLMFNGSENHDEDYFQVMESAGATELNGTTNKDRTNYFQNVPTNAIDLALWMESDRLGHLLGAVTQEKLDEQRGVVQNEKRQGENQPYGQVSNRITAATWPANHPYSHTVIGSMEDLNAASLDDVKEWFKTYYGPNNAVVVVAGNITVEDAKSKAEAMFGDIEPGPPVSQFDSWVAKRTGEQREILQDRVPQARVYKVWNVPERYTKENHQLDLVSDILGSGKNSRLYTRLVYEEQIATGVSASMNNGEIASQFTIMVTAAAGQDLKEVERVLDEELQRFLEDGPEERELDRVKVQARASFVRGIERIGGFGGKSDILATGEIFGGSPAMFKMTLADQENSTVADIHAVARKWLSDGVYVLEVHPFADLSASSEGVDRSSYPKAGEAPDARFPQIQRTELSNGLKVILAERHAAPVVEMTMSIDAGYASDHGGTLGTASLAMTMLDEGTVSRSAQEISESLAMQGATLGTFSNLDMSLVSLSALTENLSGSLDLFADVIQNPVFDATELDRLKQLRISTIRNEKSNPPLMALRIFPELLYGEGHSYGLPLTGTGTEASVASINRDDLVSFHESWFHPNNATLVVVGDVTMDELVPLLEQKFSDWTSARSPEKTIAEVGQQSGSSVYVIDRPGAQQSVIIAGHLIPPTNNPAEYAIQTMNMVFGGSFSARINMNLREDKGWTYGAQSVVLDARGQRPFFVFAPVQTDKTSESMTEIARELNEFKGDRPATDDEVLRAQQSQTLTLPGLWETNDAVESSLLSLVRYAYEDSYYDSYSDHIKSLGVSDVAAATTSVLNPDRLVWVVVGDRSAIEPGIRALDLGRLRFLDADGNLVE